MNIEVRVKTGKKENKVMKNDVGGYEVWVKARPMEGAANKDLIQVLANHFQIKPYQLKIVKGLTSKKKVVSVDI